MHTLIKKQQVSPFSSFFDGRLSPSMISSTLIPNFAWRSSAFVMAYFTHRNSAEPHWSELLRWQSARVLTSHAKTPLCSQLIASTAAVRPRYRSRWTDRVIDLRHGNNPLTPMLTKSWSWWVLCTLQWRVSKTCALSFCLAFVGMKHPLSILKVLWIESFWLKVTEICQKKEQTHNFSRGSLLWCLFEVVLALSLQKKKR